MSEYLNRISKAQSVLVNDYGGFIDITVAHDDCCAIHNSDECNCDPDITASTEKGAISILKDGSVVKAH